MRYQVELRVKLLPDDPYEKLNIKMGTGAFIEMLRKEEGQSNTVDLNKITEKMLESIAQELKLYYN